MRKSATAMDSQITPLGTGFAIQGPVTYNTVPNLYRDILGLAKTLIDQDLVLDLHQVSQADSSAIALLAALEQECGHTLRLRGLSQDLTNLAKLYGITWLVIEPDA